MLNHTKVLYLLLIATATSALDLAFFSRAEKAFNKAINSSLTEIEKSYSKNAAYVEAEKSKLISEMLDYVPGLLYNPSRSEFSNANNNIVTYSNDRIQTIDQLINNLDAILKEMHRRFAKQQVLFDRCVTPRPTTFEGRRKAVSSINKTSAVYRLLKNARKKLQKRPEQLGEGQYYLSGTSILLRKNPNIQQEEP